MAVSNSLAPAKKQTFQSIIKSDVVSKNIQSTLGDATKAQCFISSIISAVSTNPALQDCDGMTIISSALLGESLNLSPSPQLGYYYIVPFKDNKNNRTVGTFQLGYKGYLQLAIRTGQYRKINVLAIKKGELIHFDPLEEDIKVSLIQDEVERENTTDIGYYAMFELRSGFKKAMYWSVEKMETHAIKYSKGYQAKKGYTFWERDYSAMAQKTMLRQLLSKWGIMSAELQMAFENDMAFKDEQGNLNYLDNDDSVVIDRVVNNETGEVTSELKPTNSLL